MIVAIDQTKLIRMGKPASKRVDEHILKGLCLGCDQPYEKLTRGLCGPCYQATRRAIRSGKFTEEVLVKNGEMLAKSESQIGRPPTNPVSVKAKAAI